MFCVFIWDLLTVFISDLFSWKETKLHNTIRVEIFNLKIFSGLCFGDFSLCLHFVGKSFPKKKTPKFGVQTEYPSQNLLNIVGRRFFKRELALLL